MTGLALNEAAKIYIIHGIQDNLREDGRQCFDFRTIIFESNILPNCSGSSLLKLGGTKLLTGIKVEMSPPLPSAPNKGIIEINVHCSPTANFELGNKSADDMASDVSRLLTQAYSNDDLLDLCSLCIIPGQQVWALFIDVLILEYDGNLIDASSLAIKVALFNTKIASVSIKYEDGNEPEMEVSEDPHDFVSLNVENWPLLISFLRVGSNFIVDATELEETCSKCKIVFTVNSSKIIMIKEIGGPGSIHIESLQDIIETGQEMGIKLNHMLMEKLNLEKTLITKRKLFSV